ncbi:hypothetical protein NQ317_018773 [Molorchus minor]|uniref:Uncharacterized protein n=1 Tax=Molorchus minor TaxID=1323400 RepID=A0ABQ9J669_9CUCU|nr:hypothetical protein NQ317_018773 [Molorchus minor]
MSVSTSLCAAGDSTWVSSNSCVAPCEVLAANSTSHELRCDGVSGIKLLVLLQNSKVKVGQLLNVKCKMINDKFAA